jgi:hypothetical protein
MTTSRFARISCVSLWALAASCSTSCALLFDMQRGELASDDEDDSGILRGDASTDGVPPKADAGVPDGSDVGPNVDPDARFDTLFDSPIDVVPADTPRGDTNGDGLADVVPADTVVDAPRADGGIDVAPPPDVPIDSAPPPADVVRVDVAPDAPRDVTVDPAVDNSRVDAVVDTRPVDVTTDPDWQCSATTCPSGCCNNNVCVPYASQNNDTCGVGGGVCAACAANRTCAKSSAGCVTWCGLRSAPSGVAAGDYACVDFDTGLPPSNVWVPSVQETSVLQLTSIALSLPNGLESIAVGSASSRNESVLRWTSPASAANLKSVSVSAALNPGASQGADADFQVLCAKMSAGLKSEACIVFSMAGLRIRYSIYNGSGYIDGECDASGGFAQQQWTNAELHLDAVTGMIQTVIGGVVTNCQAGGIPVGDTVGFVEVGCARQAQGDIGLQVRYDNVEVSIRR